MSELMSSTDFGWRVSSSQPSVHRLFTITSLPSRFLCVIWPFQSPFSSRPDMHFRHVSMSIFSKSSALRPIASAVLHP